jgi:hypothetical protein
MAQHHEQEPHGGAADTFLRLKAESAAPLVGRTVHHICLRDEPQSFGKLILSYWYRMIFLRKSAPDPAKITDS